MESFYIIGTRIKRFFKGECFLSGVLAERELFLQEEIRILRIQMEETFVREQSFTAETVVEISSQLDLKINEYMQLTR